MSRKEVAQKYKDLAKVGAPCVGFVPDFSFDNSLYAEIGSLNEISIAMSRHSLAQQCQVRLQEITPLSSISASDDVLFDNIPDKNLDNSQLLAIAHKYEHDVLDEQNNKS